MVVKAFFVISVVIGLLVVAFVLVPIMQESIETETKLIEEEYIPEPVVEDDSGTNLEHYVDPSIYRYQTYDEKLTILFEEFKEDYYFSPEFSKSMISRIWKSLTLLQYYPGLGNSEFRT